jgi:hypothetical protein
LAKIRGVHYLVSQFDYRTAYYLAKERNADIAGSYRRYQDYLHENKNKFPPGAFALGTAIWWQLPDDNRCPHDCALESFTVAEVRGDKQQKFTTIRIRLFKYPDSIIELFYPRVFHFALRSPKDKKGLGPWRYDELTLSREGHVIHEIEWRFSHNNSCWIIEASDVEFQLIRK